MKKTIQQQQNEVNGRKRIHIAAKMALLFHKSRIGYTQLRYNFID